MTLVIEEKNRGIFPPSLSDAVSGVSFLFIYLFNSLLSRFVTVHKSVHYTYTGMCHARTYADRTHIADTFLHTPCAHSAPTRTRKFFLAANTSLENNTKNKV